MPPRTTKTAPASGWALKYSAARTVKTGDIIVRQIGMTKRAGAGTFLSRDYTIHAAKDGIVRFKQRRVKKFSGRSAPSTEVTVE